MSDGDLARLYGRAKIGPAGEVVAGSYGTWRLTYVAGSKGVAPGGRIHMYTDSDTDWGIPQFGEPEGAEYMTLQAPPTAGIAITVVDITSLVLTVQGEGLKAGNEVVLTFGVTSGGGPGSRAQTFKEKERYFWIDVDSGDGDGSVTLPDPPYLTIIGGDAARLVVVAPSTAVVGQPFRLLVRAEDEWGNPAMQYRGTVEIQASSIDIPVTQYTLGPEDNGVWLIEGCSPSTDGVHKVTVVDSERGLNGASNPILVRVEKAQHALYWGDPHGGQIAMAEKIPDFFHYARDIAGLDFVGYQRNDHSLSKEDWVLQQEAEKEFYQPGRFVPLPGFEWSGTTDKGGHHNIYFRRHGQPIRRSSHSRVEDKSDIDTDLTHITDAYDAYRNADVAITPHVGGAHADLVYHEPTLEPALEMTSTHGSFEWFMDEALERRYRIGFIGGSDSHTGRPGTDHPGHQPRRYAKSGLAALYAEEATLESIHKALMARRCYATTGARIVVRVDADQHLMGDEYAIDTSPQISVFVAGTAPLESVELFRGREKIHSHPVDLISSRNRVRVLWDGASRKTSYSGVVWDGNLQLKGGAIKSVEEIRFDSPRSRIVDFTREAVNWHSITCGYRSGLVLELDAVKDNAKLELVINTSLISAALFGGHGERAPTRMSYAPGERVMFDVDLRELTYGPKELEIGLLDRKVTVSLAPEAGAETAEFTFADPAPEPGINPYWVRVVQADMEMAWTSPVYVDYVSSPV